MAAMIRTPIEVAEIIRRFLSGGSWDWDDYTSIRIKGRNLDAIRLRCVAIHDEYPPDDRGAYCNEEGRAELARLADEAERLAGSS